MSESGKRSEGRRLYVHIAEAMSERIVNGRYPVGSRLPSERDLAQAFGVSRPTIREAIISLEIDGLVDVKIGSGVYVKHNRPSAPDGEPDVGPFELLEARRLIESEICAFAAPRIDDQRLRELETLIEEMAHENEHDVVLSEDADRRFHAAIAAATENSSLVAIVRSLWDARARSPLIRRLSVKAQQAGVKPKINEHAAILQALRARDPEAARAAMHEHLSRVIDSLLLATEVEEIERAKAHVAAQRRRYGLQAPSQAKDRPLDAAT